MSDRSDIEWTDAQGQPWLQGSAVRAGPEAAMLRLLSSIACFLGVPLVAGCAALENGNGSTHTQARTQQGEVFIRVVMRGEECPYVLEREATGTRVFHEGSLILHGEVKWQMPVLEMGALPASSGVFRMWAGKQIARSALRISVPRRGGPWRGLVVRLCDGIRYPTVYFRHVPGQPLGPRPVVTRVSHCNTANVLTCIPWSQAVQQNLIECEKKDGTPIPKSECVHYVPFTEWNVREDS